MTDATELHARTRTITSPELALVSTAATVSTVAAPIRVRHVHWPDDGEPNPAEQGRIAPGAAPCGRPEPCDFGDCPECRAREGESVLDEAKRLVRGARGGDYGHPLDNHGATAAMFAIYLERKYGTRLALDADDTCWFNVLQKASRDANLPSRDNLTDTAGYVHNIELARAERQRRSDAPA